MKFSKLRICCFTFLIVSIFYAGNVLAEVTNPLYILDYKPRVLFAESVLVDGYQGLENYLADYIGGYLHISYSITHDFHSTAGYPPFLYITTADPTVVPYHPRLYAGLIYSVNLNYSDPIDVYFVDIQFSATGYREVVTKGVDRAPFSDMTETVSRMDDNSFVALANDFPKSDPVLPYSMSFQPMRLTEFGSTRLSSFSVSTSTRSVIVKAIIKPNDISASLHFGISKILPVETYSSDVTMSDSGEITHTFNFPEQATTSIAGFNSYIFSASISKDGSLLDSTTTTADLTSPKNDYPGYSNADNSVLLQTPNSYAHFIQTLGTGFSGTLSQIDLYTSNSSAAYYGSRTGVTIYECDDETYGDGMKFDASSCTSVSNGQSETVSHLEMSSQTIYISPINFNPKKYYAMVIMGSNQYDVLPKYYGSLDDNVPSGGCFMYNITTDLNITPCEGVSDLAFYLYGVSKEKVETKAGNDSVLFLPGVEASRLYTDGSVICQIFCTDRLWEPASDADVADLFLNPDGTSKNTEIYTTNVLDEAYIHSLGPNIYKTFLEDMQKMKTDGLIADFSAVPYDWRLSLADILKSGKKVGDKIYYNKTTDTPYIESELRRLVSGSQTGKVTIVAHSNGGLLAKALLKKLQDTGDPLASKIDKIIFVAVPQIGTPAAVGALLHGADQGLPFPWPTSIFMSAIVARELGQNMSSGYNLLPSAKYFTSVETPLIIFGNDLPEWTTLYGDIFHNEGQLHNFLTGSYGRVNGGSSDLAKPVELSEALLTSAEEVHKALDNWTPPAGTKVYQIAGWGVPSTMSGIIYENVRCMWVHCGGLFSQTISPYPTFTIDGDGTVVTPSALWMNSAGAGRWWVDLKDYNNIHWIDQGLGFFSIKHRNILEIPELETFIQNIITNQSIDALPQYISTTTPITETGDTRLVYSLRSVLSLNAYDDAGHHTGISTTTGSIEENIPGSYFVTFGDKQYIFTTEPNTTHISISYSPNSPSTGSPSGTNTFFNGGGVIPFTLEVESFSGDKLLASSTFLDIPSIASTTAEITFDQNDIGQGSPLSVDTNGDGNPEIKLDIVPDGFATTNFSISTTTTTTTDTTNSTQSLIPTLIPANGPIIMSIISNELNKLDVEIPKMPVVNKTFVVKVSKRESVQPTVPNTTNISLQIASSTLNTNKLQPNTLVANVSASGASPPAKWPVIISIVLAILYAMKFII